VLLPGLTRASACRRFAQESIPGYVRVLFGVAGSDGGSGGVAGLGVGGDEKLAAVFDFAPAAADFDGHGFVLG
jgi:hypothetical protein